MSKTPTRNISVALTEPITENDDRLDDYSSENPLDFTAGSIRPNEHAFFSDVTTMKELENDLTDLLQRFRDGTLLAFSPQFTCTKMDTIRETQEQLARLHFSLDKDLSAINIESDECQKKANENMSCLMQKLQKLTEEIEKLPQMPSDHPFNSGTE